MIRWFCVQGPLRFDLGDLLVAHLCPELRSDAA